LITISEGRQKVYEKFIEDKKEVEKKLRSKEFTERVKFQSAKKELLGQEGCNYVDFSVISPEAAGLTDKCTKLNSVIYIESQLRGFERDDAGNELRWPMVPTRGLSTFFHDAGYIKMFGEDHDAIDIPATQGTPIVAPADGYVIFVRKPATADYSFLALKHSDGLVTVYGHLSEISVKEMDLVKVGEEFAKSGGAPGTPGAGVMTTGAHLHFEVWKDKVMRDPLEFLDMSILSSNNIPKTSAAIRKYQLDFKANKGYEFKGKVTAERESRTFKITGDNEIERQKNFLTTYGVGEFRKWSYWVEEGIDTDIDPTFLMCVGLAETSLGKHLKTPYNIGNVGNTDSGATRDFASPRDGIHAMARTFNNKYLGNYNKISMLSRYGNLDDSKPIYASSPVNWHNNIVTCMSHIKGKFIPDDFNFRLK
ncbi:M23 family metallopeptidase, partial [Candidatus Gracilibacteria bacterium]|nr:M23 family metallopeptidase [Candidatus Gracilibacteria bacterium]